MGKSKKTRLFLAIGIILIFLLVIAWFLFRVFEGEKPQIAVQPLPDYLSEEQSISLNASDVKRGLKRIHITLSQEGREVNVLNQAFPFAGFFNREGIREYRTEFSLDPSKLNLAQGRADLKIKVWDHSRRGGGDGNLSLIHHKMVVDTIPPAIRALSRSHYVNMGGTGLVVYQTSSDSVESGVYVNDRFFKGYPVNNDSRDGYHVCYFAVTTDMKSTPEVFLWTKDRAGNNSRSDFYFHIRRKRFSLEKFNISDRFLERVLPYFSFYQFADADSNVEKFLAINQQLRKENAQTYYGLRTMTDPSQLWDGKWLRLKNAATMAKFGDRRHYYYKGKKIDKQIHKGVDLASLANSLVPAANNGRVIFAERLGIYGETVVLDHGQGLASTYSHLNRIDVELGQEVSRGDPIGTTGQTGLAAGDHLHYGVMVGGEFVNPLEWWDAHWIQDNITRKMTLIK